MVVVFEIVVQVLDKLGRLRTVKIDFEDKKDVEKFAQKTYHYENQFDVASGQYTLKVAFSSAGESFGKLETPLNIDPYDGKMFMMSAPSSDE